MSSSWSSRVSWAWIVTEHRALDRGVGLRTSASGGGLLPLNAGMVRRIHGRGDPTFAFEQGRKRLERFGLQFEPVLLPPTLVPLRQFLQSLPSRSVVAAVAGPEFIRMVGPGADSGFGVIGAVGPSFGERGVYAVGFFYPVVPQDTARIRTQVSAAHTREHLDLAGEAFARTGRELGVI